jgi:hypothetical protein
VQIGHFHAQMQYPSNDPSASGRIQKTYGVCKEKRASLGVFQPSLSIYCWAFRHQGTKTRRQDAQTWCLRAFVAKLNMPIGNFASEFFK